MQSSIYCNHLFDFANNNPSNYDRALSLKPFKVHFTQESHEEDFQDRVEMCKTLVPMLENVDIQENIFFSDEAYYLKDKHNVRYWSETNSHVTFEASRKSPKVNAWRAMSKNKIVRISLKMTLLTAKIIYQCFKTILCLK